MLRSPSPLELALLFVLALWLVTEACRVVAHHALEAPSNRAAGAESSEPSAQCGLVTRAQRTWVGFAPGMGPADLLVSAQAAAAAVRKLDYVMCGALVRGEPVAWLSKQRSSLAAWVDHGGFEVTRVLLSGASISKARLSFQSKQSDPPKLEWSAALVREGEGWRVAGRLGAAKLATLPR